LINQQSHLLRITQHPPPASILKSCTSRIRQFGDCPFTRHCAILSASTYILEAVADAPPKGSLRGKFERVLALYADLQKQYFILFG
jgi:hypothetical protein